MRALAIAVLALSCSVGSTAAAEGSSFWDEVKSPGLRAYRHHVHEGRTALRRRRWRQALEAAERALAARPKGCEARIVRGRALARMRSLEAATEAFREALELDPTCADDPDDGAPAAEATAAAGQPALAARILRRVLGHMKDGVRRRTLYGLYGDVLLTLGPDRLHEAVLAYREVLRHQRDVRAALGLALALRRAGRQEQAAEVAREAVAHGHVDAMVARLSVPASEKAARLAVALEAIGDREGARRAWKEATEGETWREHAERELQALDSGRDRR